MTPTVPPLRCPRCGARLEYVDDGEVNGTAAPFLSCPGCEYCATVADHTRGRQPVFERLFRTPSDRVLYAVARTEDGYVILRLAAATLGTEPPIVVRRYSRTRGSGAYNAAERMAKEDR